MGGAIFYRVGGFLTGGGANYIFAPGDFLPCMNSPGETFCTHNVSPGVVFLPVKILRGRHFRGAILSHHTSGIARLA